MTHGDARFAGTWRLLSYQMQEEELPVVHPFGEQATGLLLYTEDGYMSGQLMQPGREVKAAA
ncbi:MAG: lipocalin-like domain-containing protein [Bryobacterales bacterium]|nr:lipocalin-like domain-containing protein [Bryobacterales bacterium]